MFLKQYFRTKYLNWDIFARINFCEDKILRIEIFVIISGFYFDNKDVHTHVATMYKGFTNSNSLGYNDFYFIKSTSHEFTPVT